MSLQGVTNHLGNHSNNDDVVLRSSPSGTTLLNNLQMKEVYSCSLITLML